MAAPQHSFALGGQTHAGPPLRRSRATIVTGAVLGVLGIVLPVLFGAAMFGRLDIASELAEPLAPGTAAITMAEGHGYDVLTAEPGTMTSCLVAAQDGATEQVAVRRSSTRMDYAHGDVQSPGDDVAAGTWYVAGSFTGPMGGDVTVQCDGDVFGPLTLMPDDDVFGGLGLALIGGVLLLVAGVVTFVVGLVRRRPAPVVVAPATGMPGPLHGSAPAYQQGPPVITPSGSPVAPPAPAAVPVPPPPPGPAPWDRPRDPAPWERPATPYQPSPTQPGQSDDAWAPREWQPREWKAPEQNQQPDQQPQQPGG